MTRRRQGGPIGDEVALTLDKHVQERLDQHRALLLVAMQDADSNYRRDGSCGGRNCSLVAQAMGLHRNTVRKWRDQKRWEERIEAHGPDCQAYAIELYRHLYMEKHGRKDLAHLAPVVSLPMTTLGKEEGSASEVQDEAMRVVRKLLPPEPPEEVQGQVQAEVEKRRAELMKTNTALRGVATNAISALHNSIRAAIDPAWKKAYEKQHGVTLEPIRVRLSDLPRLSKALQDLELERERLENPELAQAQGSVMLDSVRVRIAKETGGNVMEAIREDCVELLAMIDGLTAQPLTIHDLEAERQASQGGTG